MMERHGLQTAAARTMEGMGRRERMSSVRSELRWLMLNGSGSLIDLDSSM